MAEVSCTALPSLVRIRSSPHANPSAPMSVETNWNPFVASHRLTPPVLPGDIAPGEAVFIRAADGSMHAKQCAEAPKLSPCIFEHVYLARPDSTMDGVSVYQARLKMGEYLAGKIARVHPDEKIDVSFLFVRRSGIGDRGVGGT